MGDRKEQILNLSIELIQTKGFDSFSYQDLSKRLGITKASIHYHFAQKEDLCLAICDLMMECMKAFFDQVNQTSISSWEKLDQFFKKGREAAEKYGGICPLSSLQAGVGVLPERLKERIKLLGEFEVACLTKILEEGREKREMGFKGDARGQAIFIASAFRGTLQFARIHGSENFQKMYDQLKLSLAGA